ncbi:Jag family protein [Desulfocurvus sp. DL9XJH121]
MQAFKEFTDKDLDAAIAAACAHFGVERAKLEIDIVSSGSSGIFGLMGKKAVVKARLREKREPFADLVKGESVLDAVPEPPAEEPAAPKAEAKPAEPAPEAAPAAPAPAEDERPDLREPEPDLETLNAEVREVMEKLLAPIIGETSLTVSNEPGRIKVQVDDEANSGLIIGREGQTITALQYIANRILARRFQTSLRVHLDAGDYRDKQDDNLRKLALYLADKARDQGRTQSTKPLSSYHRRLVHMALQDDESVSTRSKGEGPLKRVLIHPVDSRRGGNGRQHRA